LHPKAGLNERSPIRREDSSGGASHKMQSSRLSGHQHRSAVYAGTGDTWGRVDGKNRRMGNTGRPAEPVASTGSGQRSGGTRSFAGKRSERTMEPSAGLVLDRRFKPEDAVKGKLKSALLAATEGERFGVTQISTMLTRRQSRDTGAPEDLLSRQCRRTRVSGILETTPTEWLEDEELG